MFKEELAKKQRLIDKLTVYDIILLIFLIFGTELLKILLFC